MDRKMLVYPIPLKVPSLPAMVRISKFLSPEHCARLISLAEQKGLKTIGKDRFGGESTTEACRLLPEDDTLIYDRFAQQITELNIEHWRLSLSGIYEPMRVLRYREGASIRPHIDADYRIPDPSKLTCTIQLVPKNNFSGGLMTVAETEVIELDIGEAIVFPSHMIHAVSPVQSGERIVVSAWIHGPAII